MIIIDIKPDCPYCEPETGRSGVAYSICKMDLFDGEFGSEDSLCLSLGWLILCRFFDLREQTERDTYITNAKERTYSLLC